MPVGQGKFRAGKTLHSEHQEKPRYAAESTLQFINILDPGLVDPSSRTQVRAQVMLDYHKRKTQKRNGFEETLPTPLESAQLKTQKFRLKGEEGFRPWLPVKGTKRTKERQKKRGNHEQVFLRPLAVRDDNEVEIGFNSGSIDRSEDDVNLEDLGLFNNVPVLYEIPATAVLDPFNAMAVSITPRFQLLIYHYFNIRQESSRLMIPMRKNLFSLGIHDPALFHTCLVHYAASYKARFGALEFSYDEGLYHRTMAITIVNQRVADTSQFLSDGTIAAVANLANTECSDGSLESALVHWNGLERMVRLRGGIVEGGFPKFIQRLIGWTDFHCANALHQEPRFPPLDDLGVEDFATPQLPRDWLQNPQSSQRNARSDRSSNFAERDDIVTLLVSLQSLSHDLRRLRQKPFIEDEDIQYSDKLYHIQLRLTKMVYRSPTSELSIDPACAIAALIFSAHCLRDVPFSFASIVKSVSSLKRLLRVSSVTRIKDLDGRQCEKMFWALAIGGLASEKHAERSWFIQSFRVCGEILGLAEWGEARLLLGEYLWQDELDEGGNRFWELSRFGD